MFKKTGGNGEVLEKPITVKEAKKNEKKKAKKDK
jgi:hypothetical protein